MPPRVVERIVKATLEAFSVVVAAEAKVHVSGVSEVYVTLSPDDAEPETDCEALVNILST